jgi:hypothetical protein
MGFASWRHGNQDEKPGALLGIYRHLGKGVKVGVGNNFTQYSDGLTGLACSSRCFRTYWRRKVLVDGPNLWSTADTPSSATL